MYSRPFIALCGLAALLACSSIAQAADCQLLRKPSITGLEKLTAVVEDAAEELSGLACDGGRCVLVQDEKFVVGTGTIDQGGNISVERGFELPRVNSGNEFDAEAAAFSDGYFYILGSHSVRGKTCRPNDASRALVRFKPDATAVEAPDANHKNRLYELVSNIPTLKDKLGKCLGTKPPSDAPANYEPGQGINFEGLAVVGERVLLGLRGPVLGEKAQIVETTKSYLFGDGPVSHTLHSLALSPKGGVRDLAHHQGKFLILSGSEDDDVGGAAIHMWDGTSSDAKPACTVPNEGDKPEALHVLGGDADKLEVLVLADGVEGGNPRVFSVPLK